MGHFMRTYLKEKAQLKGKDYSIYFINLEEERDSSYVVNLFNRYNGSRFLLLGEETQIQDYKEALKNRIKNQIFLNKESIRGESNKLRRDFTLMGSTPSRVIDHMRRNHSDFSEVDQVIVHLPFRSVDLDSYLGDISYILSHLKKMGNLFFVSHLPVPNTENPLLRSVKLLDLSTINYEENEVAKIPENIISAMDELVKKTKLDNEPEKLIEYKKIFKKCVPLGFRGWVIAFLLREYLSKDKSLKMPILKDPVSLFVGIGKNRKVYPKDLIHLIINTGKVERAHIGEIRILDNFAFVSIEKTSASKAIENLNGINYRGRQLNVNFAKQK